MFRSTHLYCSACGDERLFEQPPCPDGHGAECPELACTGCGAAVLIGDPPPVRAHLPVPEPVRVRDRAA